MLPKKETGFSPLAAAVGMNDRFLLLQCNQHETARAINFYYNWLDDIFYGFRKCLQMEEEEVGCERA